MGLRDVLEKMKLVELEPMAAESLPSGPRVVPPSGPLPNPSAPQASRPASPSSQATLDEILRQMPGTSPPIDESKLAAAAAAGEPGSGGEVGAEVPDFDAIYQAAGVTAPAHGFSAYKVLEILTSPDLAELNPKAKAGVVASFLKMNPSGPVPLHEVIQDALRRDQALDGFEDFLVKKLEKRRAESEQKNARLQAEIDEVIRRNKEEMDGNRRTVEAEKERIATWQARKRLEERRLFEAVAPFVEENPVTLSGTAAAAKAASPAKPEAGG